VVEEETMNWKFGRGALLAATVSITQLLVSQTPPDRQVGSLPDGGFLLNNGWILRPAGTQAPVDTLPLATVATNNGKYLLVLNCGFNTPSVSVVDIAQKREIGRTPLPDAWLGLTISSAQDRVYVGGAGKAVVYELSLNPETGALARTREFAIVPDLANKGTSFTGDVKLSADNRVLYAGEIVAGEQLGRRSHLSIRRPERRRAQRHPGWSSCNRHGDPKIPGGQTTRGQRR
jgi:hypothetical protein